MESGSVWGRTMPSNEMYYLDKKGKKADALLWPEFLTPEEIRKAGHEAGLTDEEIEEQYAEYLRPGRVPD